MARRRKGRARGRRGGHRRLRLDRASQVAHGKAQGPHGRGRQRPAAELLELRRDPTRTKQLDRALVEAARPRMQCGAVVPLDSGWLSGRYRGDHKFDDIRSRWSPEVLTRRSELVEKFAALVPEGTSLAHAALQFVLAQPQVSTVIPGAKTVAQALDNFAAADKQLSSEVVQAMYDLWRNEIEADPLPW